MSLLTPRRMRMFNGLSAVGWLVMTPVSLVTGLAQSVVFVSVLSLWALFLTSLAGYVAGRVEVAQDEADVAQDVVTKMVTDTTIEPS